ncbi:unnamed protein product [Menidia menidia]|uniref:Protein HIRA n=1 Tax=Menidia menidia TaxID=238744 RepID=A0A8S4B4T1_9TELE|nr:unnamed protein product [Menidia menidia]
MAPPAEREPGRAAAPPAAPAVLRLPTPSTQKAFSLQVSMEPSVFLEVENEVSVVAGSKLSQLRCSRDGRDWSTLLPSPVVTAAGSSEVLAVACEDRMLSVFSSCGRRLLPAIQLATPVSALHCSAHFVMVLTAGAALSVWDVHKQRALVKNESLLTILPGKPIFSVDIHPDGTKFATGGQGEDSGKVMIWNMAPVLKEEDEKNESVPKMLCQMDNHLACVNCVRWSNNGLYLASGGDDKLVMVWKRAALIGPSTVFGSSSKLANVEQWRCVTILRNHTGDVMDVAWSPHDVWLASCSVDNTIVIWNARKFPEMVTCLRGHTGLVKGLTWDPVGKYIASQADDHSLKVWRTVDWQMEANITKPFSECGGTTHVLRLSWSPDGQYLVSAHAMNNSGPTAQIVERDGWKTNMDFVGHRKAVTVVTFNPKIFKKKQKNGSAPKPGCPYCCCAVGSKDRSLSVWVSTPPNAHIRSGPLASAGSDQLSLSPLQLTSLKRPLVVIHDLFDKSIMDISWTLTGLGMLVCSMDGTVAYLDFSQDELGDPLNEEEKNTIHQNIYGKSLAITTEVQLSTTIIENPEMLKYQQERQTSAQAGAGAASAGPEAAAPKVNSVMNGESLEDIRKVSPGGGASHPPPPAGAPVNARLLFQNLLKKQVETRTADGRRRITPLCIAQLDTGCCSTLNQWFWVLLHLKSSLLRLGGGAGPSMNRCCPPGADSSVSQSLLTQQGVPVVGLSNGKSYCFSVSLETWTLIADKGDSLVQCADFRSCLPSHDAPVSSGPLAVMQGRNLNAGRLASRLSSTPHHLQQSMTLAFLENQLASALTLQSSQEYRYWLLIYARFLVNEGSEYRLRELCKELLGPVHKSTATSWEPATLGLRKRELLREVLPVIGANLRFQRLFTEYQDQLELLRSK